MTFLYSEYNSKINLSRHEMLEISQEISQDFTPCFSPPISGLLVKSGLTPTELLVIGEEIRRDFAPKVSVNSPELMLLPVDPQHLYAYWSLDDNSRPVSDNELTLRIYSQAEPQAVIHWFDLAIDNLKTSQQISLPNFEETTYSAAIGKYYSTDEFIVFAHSNTIDSPHGQHQEPKKMHTNDLSKNASGLGISE